MCHTRSLGMFTVTEPVVIAGIQSYIAAVVKISELVSLRIENDQLQFSAINSSQSVETRGRFTGLGTVSGARKSANIRARAVEAILNRDPSEPISALKVTIDTAREAQVVEFAIVTGSRLHKSYTVPCLSSSGNQGSIAARLDAEIPYYFSCQLDIIKGILRNCMLAAEEAELFFDASSREVAFRAYRDKSRVEKSSRSVGVDTSVRLPFSRFDSLRVLAPWAASFRLKEFRTMIQLFDVMEQQGPVEVALSSPGKPLLFQANHSTQKDMALMFLFLTRPARAKLQNASASMIDLGNQPLNARSASHVSILRPPSFASRQGSTATSILESFEQESSRPSSRPSSRVSNGPSRPSSRRSLDPTSNTSTIDLNQARSFRSNVSTRTSMAEDGALEPAPRDLEIGMTQDASQAIGLFDVEDDDPESIFVDELPPVKSRRIQ